MPNASTDRYRRGARATSTSFADFSAFPADGARLFRMVQFVLWARTCLLRKIALLTRLHRREFANAAPDWPSATCQGRAARAKLLRNLMRIPARRRLLCVSS